MKRFILAYTFFFSAFLSALSLMSVGTITMGCGGGSATSAGSSGSDDVTGLALPDQMALVTAEDSSSASINRTAIKTRLATVPTSGDYVNDIPNVYVYDESMKALEMPNDILCSISQTAAPSFINAGNYRAMIDNNLCAQGQDHSSDQNSQSSSVSQSFEQWIVNSSRVSNEADQIVKFWITQTGSEDGFEEIRAQANVSREATENNPFGIFSLNFKGLAGSQTALTGNLSSLARDDGQAEIMLNMAMMDSSSMKTHALISADGKTGQAYAQQSGQGGHGDSNMEETIRVAFDENHYLSTIEHGDTTQTKCLDRKNFDRNVWRYNLYNTNGSLKDLNGGFGIKTTQDNTPETKYGWASYWGIWSEQTLENGDTVYGNDGTAYEVFKAPGRLVKHTKQSATLADFVNDPLQYWDNNTGNQIEVQWNGEQLMITGELVCEPNSHCGIADITPEAMETSANQWLGFYKQGVGSINVIVPENNVLNDSTPVLYYAENFVSFDDLAFDNNGDLALKCFYNCPKAPLTAEDMNTGDVSFDATEDVNTPYLYSISSNALTLTYDENEEAVAIESGITLDPNSPNSWGMHSGALVPTSTSLDSTWDIWNATVFYTWETGPNDWNHFSALVKEDNTAVNFDAPLQCRHTTDDDKLYFIDYAGPGQLHLPYVQVSNNDTGFDRWVPLFSIDDGTELQCNGRTYFSKAMAVEQSMQEVDASECSNLSLGDIAPPTNTFTDHDMGEAPLVTDAPAVIGGVVQ